MGDIKVLDCEEKNRFMTGFAVCPRDTFLFSEGVPIKAIYPDSHSLIQKPINES
jgi:hypothetical protein